MRRVTSADLDYTIDGVRLRASSVRRHLRATFATPEQAARVAADLALLGCEASASGCLVCVSGTHAVLSQVETLLTI